MIAFFCSRPYHIFNAINYMKSVNTTKEKATIFIGHDFYDVNDVL
ncbi:hypothetical protein J2S25_002014 [Mesobacillus stamsii]|uniref:Uncharacterized protein n=1 Tax=Mesobacillus stamsii TaxID=225347 RepID=A0ABU0FV68_9BACI|nr:hypothetical protein [Mesobacillus stamsii]